MNMQLDIAPQHHLFIIGRGGANIKQIMQQTNATIHFPEPTAAMPQRKGTVYITGPIESVYQARLHLIVSRIKRRDRIYNNKTATMPQRKGTIYITGPIESVYQARLHLIVS